MAKPPFATVPAEQPLPARRITHVPMAPVPDAEAIIRAAKDPGGRIAVSQAALPIDLAAELFTAFSPGELAEEELAAAVVRLGRPNPGWALSQRELDADRVGVDPVSLATNMQAHGHGKEAEQVLRLALVTETSKHGRDSERAQDIQLALAGLLATHDQVEEAKRLFVGLVERQREKLGTRHRRTLVTLERLGLLLVDQFELTYAEPLLCEVVLVRRHLDGDDHVATLQAIGSLSALLLAQGKPSEAEPLLRRVLRGQQAAFGEAAEPVIATRNLLARALLGQGNVADAEALLTYGLRVIERQEGRAHLAWLEQVSLLGEFLLDSQRPGESRLLLADAYGLAKRMLRPESSLLAKVRGLLGRCQRQVGAFARAEEHLVAAYQAMRETLGLAHQATQKLLSEVIALYVAWDKPNLAAPYRALHATCS